MTLLDRLKQAEALLALVQKASPYDNDMRHLTLTESQYAAYVRMFDEGPDVIRALLGQVDAQLRDFAEAGVVDNSVLIRRIAALEAENESLTRQVRFHEKDMGESGIKIYRLTEQVKCLEADLKKEREENVGLINGMKLTQEAMLENDARVESRETDLARAERDLILERVVGYGKAPHWWPTPAEIAARVEQNRKEGV